MAYRYDIVKVIVKTWYQYFEVFVVVRLKMKLPLVKVLFPNSSLSKASNSYLSKRIVLVRITRAIGTMKGVARSIFII
jgi:hypothetical protein